MNSNEVMNAIYSRMTTLIFKHPINYILAKYYPPSAIVLKSNAFVTDGIKRCDEQE